MKNYLKKTQTLTPLLEVQSLSPIKLPLIFFEKINKIN